MIVTFYGASDDLVEIEGDAPGCDEYPASGDKPSEFVLEAESGRMLVTVFYGARGTWSIAPGILDEGDEFPSWPLTFGLMVRDYGGVPPGSTPEPYSMRLDVDAPDDVKVQSLRERP